MKVLITCALPYANGVIHFGHLAGTCLPSDVYARFSRLCGDDVLYVCGSDEYGMAITLSAQLAKRSPQEHVDIYHPQNKELFARLNFSFDHYSRTTWQGHVKPVQDFFLDLYREGYIQAQVTKHLYSPKERQFLADRYVQGGCPRCGFEEARGDECPKCGASYEASELINPVSKLSNSPLELRDTKHWYLRLDLFKEQLKSWIAQKKWKSNVVNFIMPYIEDLRPRAITRDSQWGVPVPLEEADGKVLYVWFDAPIGYISASMEWAEKIGNLEQWKDYWFDPQTKLVQFLGKDNIPFHAVIFPAMIMGQTKPYKLVDEMPANEFYNLEGKKFSKSEGWCIDLQEVLCLYHPDQIRYMIAATAPENSDSEFTWKEFQVRTNAELIGKWGNFIHRVLSFVHRINEGSIPDLGSMDASDQEFNRDIEELVDLCHNAYARYSLREATRVIMQFAQRCNVYFDMKKPWLMAKDPSQKMALSSMLHLCCNAISKLALITSPIMPEVCQNVWELLGNESKLSELNWQQLKFTKLPSGKKLCKPTVLFQKIEDSQVVEQTERLKAQAEQAKKRGKKSPLKAVVSVDDFKKLDLRIGKILEAQRAKDSKHLLVLKVDLGMGELRQIVAGIADSYHEEELIGQCVTVLCNIPATKIRGFQSEGMLLTVLGEQKSLLTVAQENLGHQVG